MTHVALRFAAAQPERVDALVLNTCAIANASWGMTLWRALPAENYQYFQETLVPPGLSVEERKRWLDEHRNTMTFEDYDIYSRVLMGGVVEEVLPHVQTPVLVIHQTHWTSLPQHESTRLAAALPKGRFVIDDGLGYYPRSSTVQGNSQVDGECCY